MKENKVYNLSDVIPDCTQLAQSDFIYVGDWIYIPAINEKGKVIGVYADKEWNESGYHVRMQDGRELKVLESNCKLADYIPKTAFLTEMQALLKRYNAYIFPCGYEVDGLSIVINDKYEIHYNMYEWSTMHDLSADNIFNYEKE